MTQIYKIGTATVTNGSTTVTGTDTGWATALVVGGLFTRRGLSVPIESVTDDDTLVLSLPWPGPTSSGTYTIARENSAAASVVSLVQKMSEATVTMTLSAVPPKGIGSLTQRDELDLSPEQTDFIFLHMDEVGPDLFLEFYRWGGFDWIGPFPAVIPGTPGGPGDDGPAGEGFIPSGEWSSSETYDRNNFVWIGSRNFVSIVDDNTNNIPPSADEDDEFWQFVPTPPGTPGTNGTDGTNGTNGVDGEDGREVQLQVTATHIQWRYEGDVSWTDLIAKADLKGETGDAGVDGAAGADGDDGSNGWSPVLVLASDGTRRVFQVDDWVGGEGTKPATGDYVGDAGLVADIGDAVDVRGPAGAGAGDVNTSGSVASQRLARYADGTGDVIEDSGYTVAGVLNTDNHTDGTTNKVYSATDKTKVAHISVTQAVNLDTIESDVASSKAKTDHISVTQPVDLDAIEARVNALDAVVILKGTWAANTGTFPGGGTAQAGESWIVSTGGTVNSVEFTAGDRLIAITDNASTSTYASNWFKADYTDAVQSVDGAVGAVTVGAIIAAATAKATPVDADMLVIADSAASNATKKVTWANIKATLKTYFDTLYAAASHTHTVSQLSDASANGRSLIAMTYANMKAALGLVQADISGLTTASSPQFTAIEVGAASDTTLSRGAAGFVAVEGKRVPSPASQAAGDILYRGSTEWERLPKGTAGQALVMNAGATAPEWGAGGSGQPIPSTSTFDVGTLAIMRNKSGSSIGSTATVAGSSLVNMRFGTTGTPQDGAAQSGTWLSLAGGATANDASGHFVRIS